MEVQAGTWEAISTTFSNGIGTRQRKTVCSKNRQIESFRCNIPTGGGAFSNFQCTCCGFCDHCGFNRGQTFTKRLLQNRDRAPVMRNRAILSPLSAIRPTGLKNRRTVESRGQKGRSPSSEDAADRSQRHRCRRCNTRAPRHGAWFAPATQVARGDRFGLTMSARSRNVARVDRQSCIISLARSRTSSNSFMWLIAWSNRFAVSRI